MDGEGTYSRMNEDASSEPVGEPTPGATSSTAQYNSTTPQYAPAQPHYQPPPQYNPYAVAQPPQQAYYQAGGGYVVGGGGAPPQVVAVEVYDYDDDDSCAQVGCMFSWIPLVGFITFCMNGNARPGSRRHRIAQQACAVASTVFVVALIINLSVM